MNTNTSSSLVSRRFARAHALSAATKNVCSLPGQLTGLAIIALLLLVGFGSAYGQSTKQGVDAPPVPDSWAGGPVLPSVAVRTVGVYFPTNGLFYVMGGRSADAAGSDFTHPFEYNPGTNTWATKAGTYPDNQVNNMACGVLTVGGTPQIYCVGGSAAGATTAAARVFTYNPITDVVTPLGTDNWPGNAGGNILPGGFVVTGNKLYIVAGFQISVASTSQTWVFDPNAAAGSRWLQRLDYPRPRSYVPTTAIGGMIYTAGGADIVTTTVTDTADAYRFDPVANTWTAIPVIPRATGETRALAINNTMWVIGGGRTAPNPSTQIDIYNPATNAWTTGQPFVTPRRNFATDTDGSRVWIGGGYTTDGLTPIDSMEIFTVPVPMSAVSRKVHGGAGTFDVPLPLTGTPGVECRNTGGAHTIVITFGAPVTVGGASVTSGTGTAGSPSVSGAVVTVGLTGVTNAQRMILTLANVNNGTTTGDVAIPMNVLAGDTGGNGTVSASDVGQTKSQSGQPVSGTNFREDVNANGAINGTDVAVVKSSTGTLLPP